MFVGLCRVDLHFPASRSLKAKRSILQRIKGRASQRFQASVAELDHQDLWQLSRIGIVLVGNSPRHVEERLDKIRRAVEMEVDVSVVDWVQEIQKFEPEAGPMKNPVAPSDALDHDDDEDDEWFAEEDSRGA